jgi:hypothetical protein
MTTSVAGLNESQRAVVLTALREFYCPVQVDNLNAYVAAFAPHVGSLPDPEGVVATEVSAWRSGSLGPVWICPAIMDEYGAANDAYLTRSDWGLEDRVLIHGGDEAYHLWLVRVLCDLYLVAEERGSEGLAAIAMRIRHHGEAVVSRLSEEPISSLADGIGTFDEDMIESLREAAEDSHAELAAKERSTRRQLVHELERLDDSRRLFGRSFPG